MVATDGTLATLLDTSRDVGDRVAAAAALASDERPAVIEALTRVAQQIDVPAHLAAEVGRTLGELCFKRARDVHELDMAMFSDEAGDAYDREIGRLQRLYPDVTMRHAGQPVPPAKTTTRTAAKSIVPQWVHISKFALALPGVEARSSYGTPGLYVGKKFMARLRDDDYDTMVLKPIEDGEQRFLMETEPDVFFLTPHYVGYPTILVRLSKVDRAQLEALVEQCWRALATKTMLKQPDAAGVGADPRVRPLASARPTTRSRAPARKRSEARR